MLRHHRNIQWIHSAQSARVQLTIEEVTGLMCLVISEGARHDVRCISVVNTDSDLILMILESGKEGISGWMSL
jgi:hypothetical protein